MDVDDEIDRPRAMVPDLDFEIEGPPVVDILQVELKGGTSFGRFVFADQVG